MLIGLGWRKLLEWYDPYAGMLWSAHNNLKAICDKLCDPDFALERQSMERQKQKSEQSQKGGLGSYLPKSEAQPEFGCPFSPMLSERTGFDRILDDISGRHRAYLTSQERVEQYPNVPPDSLAFRHPAVSIETKLDGERQLIHINKDGIVKKHSRSSNWCSNLYSPVLGPALRRAVPIGLNVILDGEVIAWDNGRKETIPFGVNRTIAGLRQKWMDQRGMLDRRDIGVHDGDPDAKSMSVADHGNSGHKRGDEESEQAGAECWLQFVAFDVVYIDGEGATDFLSKAVSSHVNVLPGPLVDLDCMERKKILYRLLTPQKTEVEIVDTTIVRPNGSLISGENYFSFHDPLMECGYPAYVLDSLSCTLSGTIVNQAEIDTKCRNYKSDEQVSQARAHAIHSLYNRVVEQQRQEGIIFKDLNAPYYLGDRSKTMRYAWKFKPDFFNESSASDLDVTIIGAYFATGLQRSGEPSALLCACVDSESRESFFPVCKVNLGSMDRKTSNGLLRHTGFQKSDEGNDRYDDFANKWFRGDKDTKAMPKFVSKKSSPHDTNENGWRVAKKDYSRIILTLNAGELVVTDAYSAGLTLRFTRIRDDKNPHDIESEATLRGRFEEVQQSRVNAGTHAPLQLANDSIGPCRFLTESQYEVSKKQRKKTRKTVPTVDVVLVPQSDVKSQALRGLSFVVVGATGFSWAETELDVAEWEETEWIEMAKRVKGADSVKRFIQVHGGTLKCTADVSCCDILLGGSRDDRQVATYIQAIENSSQRLMQTSKGNGLPNSGKKLTAMASCPGVLRWTFVYSLVNRWQSTGVNPTKCSIKEIYPQMLVPNVLDFLARPGRLEGSTSVDPEVFDLDLSKRGPMRQALAFVNDSKKNKNSQPGSGSENLNWRDASMNLPGADERWVVATTKQALWPFRKGEDALPHTVIYPAISDESNENASCCSIRSSQVAAVLPLARVMGAFVVPKLDSSVTHILCDLKEGIDEVLFDDTLKPEVLFVNVGCGKKLKHMVENISFDFSVRLVSPYWVRKHKWMDHSRD